MYCIISGTNREGSKTLEISRYFRNILERMEIETNLFDLRLINMTLRNESFRELEEKYLIPAEKLIVIVPEYNGSFPGILKLMLDMCDLKQSIHHKKVMLTGISSGRAGNLRGLDVLTNMFHYMKCHVHPVKLPISSIETVWNGQAFIQDITTRDIEEQIKGFVIA